MIQVLAPSGSGGALRLTRQQGNDRVYEDADNHRECEQGKTLQYERAVDWKRQS
jgi:hypothetical protein